MGALDSPTDAPTLRELQEDAMTTITFDTLAYVKTLRDAGVSELQAEAQA
ncbi:hypothetical protein CCP3SC15_1490003 [Gammaproteobacteria bacterium]